ncbi:Rim21p [Sugiyamaella lignohabitans]|uniref:pH-response regulator protein palH/RIM21 n=1 Tax=Sugiyamaella lignohabitans TaxID=796027 RepID=A0A167C771_9ASCO|nr:Rim21p [Sugiyamaella lignohabitans]ANB11305.1 Rim21p [Sugiyamaella lignohabitans]
MSEASMKIAERDIWRQPSPTTQTAVGCQPLVLSTGTMILNATKTVVIDPEYPATYTPFCPNGVLPIGVFKSPTLMEMGDYGNLLANDSSDLSSPSSTSMPMLLPFSNWQSPFYTSTVPATIAIAATTTVCWTLTLALFCSPRRPVFMKSLLLIACVCMTIMSAVYMKYLRRQYDSGFVDGLLIVDNVDDSTLESVALMIGEFVLLLAELTTLMRLFPRKREQRLIVFTGALVICTDRVLWGISAFEPSSPEDRTDPVDAIIVFAYLFSIATSIIYAGAIVIYSWWKWRIAYKPDLLIIAFLSHIATFLPIVLFVLDLADQYLDSWSTYAKLASLLCASVCVWVWVDRIEDYEKTLELHSVLGRQQYTEDHNPFDFEGGHGKLSFKAVKHLSASSDNSTANSTVDSSKPNNNKTAGKQDTSKRTRRSNTAGNSNNNRDQENAEINNKRNNTNHNRNEIQKNPTVTYVIDNIANDNSCSRSNDNNGSGTSGITHDFEPHNAAAIAHERKRHSPSLSTLASEPNDHNEPPITTILSNSTTNSQARSSSTPLTSPANASKTWNSRLLKLIKFNILNRPGTSSSTQTTYVVSSADHDGAPDQTASGAIPLQSFDSSSSEGPMTVHKHPFRSTRPQSPA